MKIMVISDIHGVKPALEQALTIFKREGYDRLLILGDLYYHGPRNPIQEGYDPMGCSELLKTIQEKLIIIRGNCDAEVDMTITGMRFKKEIEIRLGSSIIRCMHGHEKGPLNLPQEYFDLLLYGHFHCYDIEKTKNGKYIASPGSLGIPRDGKQAYFVISDDHKLKAYDLMTSKLIEEIKFN